jgi:hypothetical protein
MTDNLEAYLKAIANGYTLIDREAILNDFKRIYAIGRADQNEMDILASLPYNRLRKQRDIGIQEGLQIAKEMIENISGNIPAAPELINKFKIINIIDTIKERQHGS